MSTSRLASLLVQEGLVSAKRMAQAFQRQVIYGGTLDTIVLEMDALDEARLVEAMGRAAGMPTAGELPSREQLEKAGARDWFPLQLSERFRAVPIALDGNVLRVLVTDPPDRRQLDELGYMLSRSIDPIIATEHRFVHAVERVYGVPVPARFASLAAKLHKRREEAASRVVTMEAEPARPQPEPPPATTSEPEPEPAPAPATAATIEAEPAPATTIEAEPEPATATATTIEAEPEAAGEAAPAAGSAEPSRLPLRELQAMMGAPMLARPSVTAAPSAPTVQMPAVETSPEVRRAVVTDVPLPGREAAPAPVEDSPTPRARPLREAAPTALTPEVAVAHLPESAPPPASEPLGLDEAARLLDAAPDRDAIFETLCRGARSRLDFVALFMVHGEVVAGRLGLGAEWLPREALSAVSISLERPSAVRAAVQGLAPWLGRLGEDAPSAEALRALGKKPPLPAVLLPIVLRDRAVALLYGDNEGRPIDGSLVAGLSTMVAAAGRSFQRLILRQKSGEFSARSGLPDGKARLSKTASLEAVKTDAPSAPPGWHAAPSPTQAAGGQPERKAKLTTKGFPAFTPTPAPSSSSETQPETRPESTRPAAAPQPVHDAPTAALPSGGPALTDAEGLVESIVRGDAFAQMAAEALPKLGARGAEAVVARLPGPLTLDRRALRAPLPPLSDHGPLLAALSRLGAEALRPLVQRLADPSVEVRYYATYALGELTTTEVVAPLGQRLTDPDAGVRRAAVLGLQRFQQSPELRTLTESLRGELPGPEPLRQRYASEALGVLRDVPSVPRLIELVKHHDADVVTAARQALIEITKQDFGTSRWRWRSWWERHRDEPRVEWMLEGLGHSEEEVRLSASEELRALSSESFGYTPDLPKREREEARRKWIDWWRQHGNQRQADKRS